MDTQFNSPPKTPNSTINSPSSASSTNPNSPLQTLPPSRSPSDFGDFSPLSDETIPDYDPPDPDEEFEESEELSLLPPPPSSIYRWSEGWMEREPAVEESRMSGSDLTEWHQSSSELVEYKPPAAEDSTEWPNTVGVMEPKPLDFFSENKPFLLGAGLANLGNTCFLNSILQCFIHTVPLLRGLISCDHKVPCESYIESFCVICALRELIEFSLISTGGIVSPWKLVNNLSYISSCFQRYQQEDAHEFLQCFLDKLENSFNDSASSESVNFVKNVFGGRLVSKLKCCNCNHCSDTYEPSIDLSLEIGDVESLVCALESFTKVEKIEDPETQFTCENCKEKVSVEKQLLLDQAPSVATFHLKRFKSDGSYVEKIDKHVQFPQELDLLPYTSRTQSDDDVELKYELFAVVVHIGYSSTSGHYYCFIRASPDSWYKFDDSMVVRVREEYVLEQEAYILFYAKQGTPWFSSFIESQKPFLDATTLNTSPKSVLDGVGLYSTSPTVLNNFDCDVNETSDAAEEAATEILNRPEENKVEGSEAIDDSSVKPTHIEEQVISPSALEENCSPKFGIVSKASNITPTTPPRSPSPEIYREDPPEDVFSIPRGHLRMVDQVSCTRQVNKEKEDMERTQACLLIKKKIPGSRGQQLMAAMKGSRSEGSINKKRSRRMEMSPTVDDRNSAARRRSSVGPGFRILAAGSLR